MENKEEIYQIIEEFKKKLPIDELKELGIDVDDPEKFLLFLGVATGAIQIVKRGNKFYYRVTPPQNLPMAIAGDEYPERLKQVLSLTSQFMREGRSLKYVKEKWEELKKAGLWKKEERILTDEQIVKLLDRLSRLLPYFP
jgi:hypothetical protein